MWWFLTPLFLTSLVSTILAYFTYLIANTFDSDFFEYLTGLCLVPLLMFIFLAPINLIWYILVLFWTPFI
jgi:hypothetical protein